MRCFIVFLFFIPIFSFSQNSSIFKIDSLPTQGILLDKDWKWHAGDNPEYARTDLDDSGWGKIDPTLDIFALPQLPKTGEIFWLRLHLSLDSALNQQTVIKIEQSGATEVFLNGKQIAGYGLLSKNITAIKAANSTGWSVSFPIQKSGVNVLSVRYAFQPHILYNSHWGYRNKCFAARINSPENANAALDIVHSSDKIYMLLVGVFVILCPLYFVFYIFYPTQKFNLYFSGYALSQILFWSWLIYYYSGYSYQLENLVLQSTLFLTVVVSGYLFLLLAVYRLLNHKLGFFFWLTVVLTLLSMPAAAFIYGWGWLIHHILIANFYNIIFVAVAFRGVKTGKKGAGILLVGGLLALIIWGFFGLSAVYNTLSKWYFLIQPLSVAIFLGYEMALANRKLQQKLKENEKLAEEKQQILATQNKTLEKKVTERTAELEQSLKELKQTQNQLVLKEKLASLGELTAGIAHEIQNPLNFVNNFSELSVDLVKDVNEEISKEKIDKDYVKDLMSDLTANQQKINHHGKRASSIVKGMLEHSRASTGEREMLDINKLADEYLRLSYHGLRAKDKMFNSDYKTDFDETIPKMNVVPQDIGRVLLNLINNAFYAVNERAKQYADKNYAPLVSVSTKRLADKIEITVKDNGTGIPDKIKEKIFQPFFTTKPTGEGTGLGLSLAYDIITKGHGGTLEVESREGDGSEFIILLSIKTN